MITIKVVIEDEDIISDIEKELNIEFLSELPDKITKAKAKKSAEERLIKRIRSGDVLNIVFDGLDKY